MRDRTSPTPNIQPVLGCQKRWGVRSIRNPHNCSSLTMGVYSALKPQWDGWIQILLPSSWCAPSSLTSTPTSPLKTNTWHLNRYLWPMLVLCTPWIKTKAGNSLTSTLWVRRGKGINQLYLCPYWNAVVFPVPPLPACWIYCDQLHKERKD